MLQKARNAVLKLLISQHIKFTKPKQFNWKPVQLINNNCFSPRLSLTNPALILKQPDFFPSRASLPVTTIPQILRLQPHCLVFVPSAAAVSPICVSFLVLLVINPSEFSLWLFGWCMPHPNYFGSAR